MGFLDKLWDETLAGPMPETGLGRLRKFKSFNDRRTVVVTTPSDDHPPASAAAAGDQIPVSRSISILRRSDPVSPGRHVIGSPDAGGGSGPSSPAESTTPTSPFSPRTPRGDQKKLARGISTPTGYDWIVLSALDR